MPRLSIQKAVSCTHAEYVRHAGTKVEVVRYAEDMAYVNVYHGTEAMPTPLVPEYTKFNLVRRALIDFYGIELPFQRQLSFAGREGASRRTAYAVVRQ